MKTPAVSPAVQDVPMASLRRSRARFAILALIAIGIAAPTLTRDLRLSAAVMGLVFPALSWTCTASQIPAGMFLDRIGGKKTYFLAVANWSTFIVLHGFVGGLASLLVCRLGLGVAESPCFSANSRVVGHWFPQRERARATRIYQVGQYVGLAVFSPLLFWISAVSGWRAMFVIVGSVGPLFSLVCWLRHNEPHEPHESRRSRFRGPMCARCSNAVRSTSPVSCCAASRVRA